MLAVDSETTGTDLEHGARPFFITLCYDDGEQLWYEWDVDPLTRLPKVVDRDVQELTGLFKRASGWGKFDGKVAERHTLVLQNAKFDCSALATVGVTNFPWEQVHDTLIAGHLLASNQPHDLTSMVLQYLGWDIQPYEDKLEKACKQARHLARKHFPNWRIAKEGLPEMPSAKSGKGKTERGAEDEAPWKFDTWLPKTIARELGYEEGHPWYTVLQEYANTDSATTVALWKVQKQELLKRGLWEIYLERRKLLPIVQRMQQRGVTVSGDRLEELKQKYEYESGQAGRICVNIAASLGYELNLPKGASNNKSLVEFCFGPLNLPPVKRSNKTGNPSLDKYVLEEYEATLPPNSKALTFIRQLRGKRARDTARTYLNSYKRMWLPMDGEPGWYRLHPSLNPTGTDTLRMSCSNPNGQNISKKEDFNLRYAFGPAPGREWWSLDYENLELRLPAYESGEQAMITLFERPDDPPYFGSYHLLNASLVYPDLFWPLAEDKGAFKKKYASTWYQWIKNAGFALIYGCQKAKFDATAHKAGAYDLLKANMQELFRLSDHWVQFANKHGYVETMPDKTVDPNKGYPVMCSRTEWGKINPTVPLNYHIQSTACWIAAKAMVRCEEQLNQWTREDPRGYHMALQVHDEIVFDFPYAEGTGNTPKAIRIKELMEMSGNDVGIPLKVAVTYNPHNWSEGADPLAA